VGVDTRNVHGYILGEHGDTELPAWSLTSIAGMTMDEYCETCRNCSEYQNRDDIFKKVKNAAYEIIKSKGATYFAVALAVQRIAEAVMRDESSILTVSSIIDGKYGIKDVALSIPTIVGREGIKKVLEIPITKEELTLLNKSADTLKGIIKELKL
jgi:L-lactate dehydrogenase